MVTANSSGSSVSSSESLAPAIQPIQTLLVPVIAPERENVDAQETNQSAPLSWGELESFPDSYTPPTSGLEPVPSPQAIFLPRVRGTDIGSCW